MMQTVSAADGGLGTGLRDRRLAREEPIGERVARLCCAGDAPDPLRAANLTRISVPDVSPGERRHDDMHDYEDGEDPRIGLAVGHPPSVPPQGFSVVQRSNKGPSQETALLAAASTSLCVGYARPEK